MMIELYARNWRPYLDLLLRSAERDVLIACPFIKTVEASWVCETLASKRTGSLPTVRILTDLRSDTVLSGGLDIRALKIFCESGMESAVINLPRLHSKVYIADTRTAIVTSGNLTPSGLEGNFEYGVGFKDEAMTSRVRADLEAYARMGNPLAPAVLHELEGLALELKRRHDQMQRSSDARLRRRFARVLDKVNFEFLKAQVGSRSGHSLFSDAILYVLSSKGPMGTRKLAPEIQRLLPDLCDDSKELIINGERFGKRWKHDLRNAQQALKRRRILFFNGTHWAITEEARRDGVAV